MKKKYFRILPGHVGPEGARYERERERERERGKVRFFVLWFSLGIWWLLKLTGLWIRRGVRFFEKENVYLIGFFFMSFSITVIVMKDCWLPVDCWLIPGHCREKEKKTWSGGIGVHESSALLYSGRLTRSWA